MEQTKPLMTIDTNGVELRVIEQFDSPWPYSVQIRVSRKKWEQVNAFTNKSDAFQQAVYFMQSKMY